MFCSISPALKSELVVKIRFYWFTTTMSSFHRVPKKVKSCLIIYLFTNAETNHIHIVDKGFHARQYELDTLGLVTISCSHMITEYHHHKMVYFLGQISSIKTIMFFFNKLSTGFV